MKPRLITAPSEPPVTDVEAQGHCRVEPGEDDTAVAFSRDAAVAHLDGYAGVLGRCIITQTWGVPFAAWAGRFTLPFPDVSGVIVKYLGGDDVEQTLAASEYDLIEDHGGAAVVFNSGATYPEISEHPQPITVETTAGYGLAADVPADLKQLVLLLTGHFYQHREAGQEKAIALLPYGVKEIIAAKRWSQV